MGRLSVTGGSFINNTASISGGAISMVQTFAMISSIVSFFGNTIGPGIESDLSCTANSQVETDGTTRPGGSSECLVLDSSENVEVMFPGNLGGFLFPKAASGQIDPNLFAALEFDSLVEVDTNGNPIEYTRLSKSSQLLI